VILISKKSYKLPKQQKPTSRPRRFYFTCPIKLIKKSIKKLPSKKIYPATVTSQVLSINSRRRK
jgi:hypothetical protein